MKVKDLLKTNVTCIDVYENVAELIGIAFEWDNTIKLTTAGKKHFQKALNYEVEKINGDYLILDTVKTVSKEEIDKCDFEETIPNATQNAIEFFWALAGYCSNDDFNTWFEEIETAK